VSDTIGPRRARRYFQIGVLLVGIAFLYLVYTVVK
jgi:hypothetical protein